MKLKLDVPARHELFNTFNQFDGRIVNGERVPYKLGAHRRAIVKNLNVLRASLAEYEEARKSIFGEFWPDKNPMVGVERKDDPDKFDKFKAEIDKVAAVEEELELDTLPSDVLYGDNELPLGALAVLEQNGLIVGEPVT